MQRASWWAICLLAAAGVAGCAVESHSPAGRFEGKLEARQRLTAMGFVPTPGEDVCADNEWYGDGECDFWCPEADGDCNDNVVCAAYVEESDGLCRRADSDPCRSQDPDCDVSCIDLPIFPGRDGVCTADSTDPCVAANDLDCGDVGCAEFIEAPDMVCSRADDDKCRFQDPDCDDTGVIVCPAISQFSDGVCIEDPADPCLGLSDPDCGMNCAAVDYALPLPDGVCIEDNNPCNPVDPDCATCDAGAPGAAPMFVPPTDGVCEDDMDPCTPEDPDCSIACAEYIGVPDGVCDRDPSDPCIFQDPDCDISCMTPGVPPVADGVCIETGDACNIDPDCTVCAFFAPPLPSDGVCDGDPNDPCSFQGDVDCGVVCAAYIEAPDGQCNRFEKDACISQDPDCAVVDCSLVDPNPTPDMICPFALDAPCRGGDPDCAVDLNQ